MISGAAGFSSWKKNTTCTACRIRMLRRTSKYLRGVFLFTPLHTLNLNNEMNHEEISKMSEKELFRNLTNHILTGPSRRKLWEKADEIVTRGFSLYPDCFNTSTHSIPYEMRYIPPFEAEFKELKHLQIKASQAAPLFHEYRGYIILDLSQYAGHESEYYLDISLKFLRDMASDWAYIFIVNRNSSSCRAMTEKIAGLFCDLPLSCWSTESEEGSQTMIKRILDDCQTYCSDKTTVVLQEILDKRVLNPSQMSILIRETLKRYTRITPRVLNEYLNSSDSIMKAILSADKHEELIRNMKGNQKEHDTAKTV